MGFQDIVALGLAAMALIYAGRKTMRTLLGKSKGCARGCDRGPQATTTKPSSPELKRTPLVQLDISPPNKPDL